MGPNQSRRPEADSGNRIRLKVLLPAVLLPVLAIFLFATLHSAGHRSPAKETITSTAAAPSNQIAPAHPAIHHSPTDSASALEAEPETARLTSIMTNSSLSLSMRRQAARSLAMIGTDEAMAQLKAALTNDSPPYVKAAIAEGLGQCPNPEAQELLHELVNGKDQTVARAAARGFAARGDADAVQTLGNLLYNAQTPLGVRTESALALGDVDASSAQDLLTKAVTQIQEPDVVESVLDGLGRRPFSETEDFFRGYLDSTGVAPDLKVLAIQAITDSDGDVATFLSKYQNDPNPSVRAAAKSALDFLGPSTENAPK